MIAVHRKPRRWPSCGSNRIAENCYGMLSYSEDLKQDIAAGRVIQGGCGRSFDHPDCRCGQTFQRERPRPGHGG